MDVGCQKFLPRTCQVCGGCRVWEFSMGFVMSVICGFSWRHIVWYNETLNTFFVREFRIQFYMIWRWGPQGVWRMAEFTCDKIYVLYMCVYITVYVSVYIHMHAYIYICMCIHIYVCVYIHMYVYIYISLLCSRRREHKGDMCMYTYIYTVVYTHMYKTLVCEGCQNWYRT